MGSYETFDETETMGKKLFALLGLVAALAGVRIDAGSVVEHRGCCSHHGGVCGCQNARALCCDGELSPSCGCD
jgi:hypothetical protein